MDTLEILSSLIPAELLLKKICFRAIMQIYTLPEQHLLSKLAATSFRKCNIMKQPTLYGHYPEY